MLMMMMMANADYIYCLFFLLLYCILMWREDEEAWQETKLWSISRTVNLFWFLQECWQDASSSAPITSQPSQASLCLSVSLSPQAVVPSIVCVSFCWDSCFHFLSPFSSYLTSKTWQQTCLSPTIRGEVKLHSPIQFLTRPPHEDLSS
jgi:hypothetical protein